MKLTRWYPTEDVVAIGITCAIGIDDNTTEIMFCNMRPIGE